MMTADQLKKRKRLQTLNERLSKAVSDLTLDKTPSLNDGSFCPIPKLGLAQVNKALFIRYQFFQCS